MEIPLSQCIDNQLKIYFLRGNKRSIELVKSLVFILVVGTWKSLLKNK